MPKTQAEPTLVRSGSHWIELGTGTGGLKEEVYLYYATEWRGAPVIVSMRAHRYSGSSIERMIPWQVSINEANEGNEDQRGRELTSVAKKNMWELLVPLVREWLDTDAYTASESGAYFDALRREIREARPSVDNPTYGFRRQWELHRAKLTPAQSARLVRMADAYDAFAVIYNGTDD